MLINTYRETKDVVTFEDLCLRYRGVEIGVPESSPDHVSSISYLVSYEPFIY